MSDFTYKGKKVEFIHIPRKSSLNVLNRFKNPVVFLHGLGDCFQNNLDIIEFVAEIGHEAYAINFPGSMGSEQVSEISWDMLVDIVRTLLERKKLKDVILFGHSMGGGIALKCLEAGDLSISALKSFAPFCYDLNPGDIDDMAKGYLKFWGNLASDKNEHSPDSPDPLHAKLLYLVKEYLKIFFNFNLNLKNNTVPIIVVLSEKDELINHTAAQNALSKIGQVKIVSISSTNHNLYFETDRVKKEVVRLLFPS